MESLDFQMHRYWLELVLQPTVVQPEVPGFAISISPNPFRGNTQIRMSLPEDVEVSWEAYDIRGGQVANARPTLLPEGNHLFQIGDEMPAGIYLVRLQVGASMRVLKVVKCSE